MTFSSIESAVGTLWWTLLIYIVGGFTMRPAWNHVLKPLASWLVSKLPTGGASALAILLGLTLFASHAPAGSLPPIDIQPERPTNYEVAVPQSWTSLRVDAPLNALIQHQTANPFGGLLYYNVHSRIVVTLSDGRVLEDARNNVGFVPVPFGVGSIPIEHDLQAFFPNTDAQALSEPVNIYVVHEVNSGLAGGTVTSTTDDQLVLSTQSLLVPKSKHNAVVAAIEYQ